MTKKEIVVAFATDHCYRHYTGVALSTLIEHSSAASHYVILILAEALPESDRMLFTRLIEDKTNFSLRFIELQTSIDEYGARDMPLGAYNIPILYRLFIHELLPEYDKVLYLDSDIVVQSDVKNLFEEDLGGLTVGAVKDRLSGFPISDPVKLKFYVYIKKELQLGCPCNYFNSGVLLLDLKKMRNSNFSQQVFCEINSGKEFKFADQDILNRLLYDDVRYLDKQWNFMIGISERMISPKIIHFPGNPPWYSRIVPHADIWWRAAEKTFFIEELKRELQFSSARLRFLENKEKAYYEIARSSSWRFTVWLRFISNTFQCISFLFKVMFDRIKI